MAENERKIGEIENLIANVAREQFPNTVVETVHVREDTDSDGDPIFRVIVVFESAKGLERLKTSSFVRLIRPKLEERDQFRFPLVSFMTSADAKKLAAA